MNKKILYGFLPIFLSLVVLFVPISVNASEVEKIIYSGVLLFSGYNPYISLDASLVYNDGAENDRSIVTYNGTFPENMQFDQIEGYTYTGSANYYVRYTLTNSFPVNTWYSAPKAFISDFSVPDGITISAFVSDYSYDFIEICYTIQCNNYVANYTGKAIGYYNLNLSASALFNDSSVLGYAGLNYERTQAVDFHGFLYEYVTVQESPGYEGTVTSQNDKIISQNNTQNSLIQNQTSQQHQDSQAEINQSIQNTDQITNGYNSTQMGDAENKFESGAGDLTDIEDTLTDSSSSYVNNFTDSGFDTSFLQSVGPSLNYVVTWFTNFWNMGGALTSTYGLSFAIFIAFYILRVRG